MLTTHENAVRKEFNALIIYAHNGLDELRVWRTQVGYLLCADIVPLDRALGIWSLRANRWFQKPESSILQEMTGVSSTKDLMCHITHLQLIFEKRKALGAAADKWSRQQYVEYVARSMKEADYMARMLENFTKEIPSNQRGYVNLTNETNPNEREFGEEQDPDMARIRALKGDLFAIQVKAIKKYMKATHGGYDSSDSAYDAPEETGSKLQFGFTKRIAAKNMPRPPTPPPAPGAARAASTKAMA
eukprot:s782_g5.t1